MKKDKQTFEKHSQAPSSRSCSICKERSKNVHRSTKYDKYLCVDCLVETILNDKT